MHEHERQVGRRDAANTAGLTERLRTNPLELLAGLGAEVSHVRILESPWDRPRRHRPLPLDALPLHLHIARVPDVILHLLDHLGRHGRERRQGREAVVPADLWPLQAVEERDTLHPRAGEQCHRRLDPGCLRRQPLDTLKVGEPQFGSHRREPTVGVVVP